MNLKIVPADVFGAVSIQCECQRSSVCGALLLID